MIFNKKELSSIGKAADEEQYEIRFVFLKYGCNMFNEIHYSDITYLRGKTRAQMTLLHILSQGDQWLLISTL